MVYSQREHAVLLQAAQCKSPGYCLLNWQFLCECVLIKSGCHTRTVSPTSCRGLYPSCITCPPGNDKIKLLLLLLLLTCTTLFAIGCWSDWQYSSGATPQSPWGHRPQGTSCKFTPVSIITMHSLPVIRILHLESSLGIQPLVNYKILFFGLIRFSVSSMRLTLPHSLSHTELLWAPF